MNFFILQAFALELSQNPPLLLQSIKRIGDNLFRLAIASHVFYFDLTKGKSLIFTSPKPLIASKHYQAPFDISLQKHCNHTLIEKIQVEGNNRILQFFLHGQKSYKSTKLILQAEFTGKNTNLILLDSNHFVLDALRHISTKQSFREVKIHKKLLSLPSPPKAPNDAPMQKPLFEMLAWLYEQKEQQALSQKIHQATQNLQKKINQIHDHLHTLKEQEEALQKRHLYFEYGKTILAHLYQYPNFYGQSLNIGQLQIPIPKEASSLSMAAQMHFDQAKKLEKKAKNIHLQFEHLYDKLAFYDQLSTLITQAKSLQDLEILDSNTKQKAKEKKQKKYESFFVEGYKISIGKNQTENIRLLQDAKAEDIWMHIKDQPSSHLIIHCGKSKIPDIIIHKAAQILIGFAKGRQKNYIIDMTKRRFVKITQGACVVYSNQSTLNVSKD